MTKTPPKTKPDKVRRKGADVAEQVKSLGHKVHKDKTKVIPRLSKHKDNQGESDGQ